MWDCEDIWVGAQNSSPTNKSLLFKTWRGWKSTFSDSSLTCLMAPTTSFSFFLILLACISRTTACYTAVFGFGDSLTDAGNLIHLETDGSVPHMYYPPYGETFFGHPTGRCSDGRVILDLIGMLYIFRTVISWIIESDSWCFAKFAAEHYGLAIPPPSLSQKAKNGGNNIRQGVNFAVVGSRALDAEFYEKLDIFDTVTNVSMTDQLHAFKDMIPSLCNSPSGKPFTLSNFDPSFLFVFFFFFF